MKTWTKYNVKLIPDWRLSKRSSAKFESDDEDKLKRRHTAETERAEPDADEDELSRSSACRGNTSHGTNDCGTHDQRCRGDAIRYKEEKDHRQAASSNISLSSDSCSDSLSCQTVQEVRIIDSNDFLVIGRGGGYPQTQGDVADIDIDIYAMTHEEEKAYRLHHLRCEYSCARRSHDIPLAHLENRGNDQRTHDMSMPPRSISLSHKVQFGICNRLQQKTHTQVMRNQANQDISHIHVHDQIICQLQSEMDAKGNDSRVAVESPCLIDGVSLSMDAHSSSVSRPSAHESQVREYERLHQAHLQRLQESQPRQDSTSQQETDSQPKINDSFVHRYAS